MIAVQNESLFRLMRPAYAPREPLGIRDFLRRAGTFRAVPLPSALYPAAGVTRKTRYTGYGHVWVRDNVHIAHARFLIGDRRAAVRTALALARFFRHQAGRFLAIIEKKVDADDVRNRPWVRFDGRRPLAPAANWSHAQNDALGYFLWLYCRLAALGALALEDLDGELLGLFVRYFGAIRYWKDEDSGHWEETRKISASSIGVVLSGLGELERLQRSRARGAARSLSGLEDEVAVLVKKGEETLAGILPWECRQTDLRKRRRYDAALLFLDWPLGILSRAQSATVLGDVLGHLAGECGIRRYRGDSFWCADYRKKLPPKKRTSDMSLKIEERDAISGKSEEAQWCLFDPVVSLIAAREYARTGRASWLSLQTHHLNRSLGHLTGSGSPFGELRCPELYHREAGVWTPSDATPLLWTQGLLEAALLAMHRSALL